MFREKQNRMIKHERKYWARARAKTGTIPLTKNVTYILFLKSKTRRKKMHNVEIEIDIHHSIKEHYKETEKNS